VLAARARDGRPSAVLLLAVQTPGAVAEESDDASAVAPPRRPADASLAMVGEVLSRNTRGGDFVGRYGDHEFVVLLPDVTYVEAHGTAERLRDAIAAQRGAGLGGSAGSRAPDVVVTVGVAAAPEHGTAVEALVAAAETALRRAQRGRPPASAGGSPLLAASLLLE
jgi:predicted signal transduction protein with EAL and GGDEF domain